MPKLEKGKLTNSNVVTTLIYPKIKTDRNLANILTKPVINNEGTKTVSTSDLDGNHRDPLLISKQEPWYIEDATIKDGRLD